MQCQCDGDGALGISARIASRRGDPDIVKMLQRAEKKPISSTEHVKSMDSAFRTVENCGLEKFLPHMIQEVGQKPVLMPAGLAQRPMLVFRADQAASGFAGAWFLAEVPRLRIRCAGSECE